MYYIVTKNVAVAKLSLILATTPVMCRTAVRSNHLTSSILAIVEVYILHDEHAHND